MLWELPLVVGLVAGGVLTWLRGGLFVLDRTPAGYHWNNWLHNAWYVVNGPPSKLDGFRKPLFGYLAGTLGEAIGYADAGIVMGSAAVAGMLVAAGLLGRALGGPAAGGVAALGLGATPLVQNAAHWATGYPLLAAGTGLSLAFAALFAVVPRRSLLVATAASVVLALASEDRGLMVLPVVVGLVAVGMRRAPGKWRMALLLGVGVAVAPPAIDHALDFRAPVAMSMAEKRQAQKGVVHRWLQIEQDRTLVAACSLVHAHQTLEPAFFTTRCAREVLRFNSWRVGPRATMFPAAWLLGCAALWFVGGRRRGRQATLVAGVLGGGTWLVFAAATPMPHRYILQFVVPLAVVVPVASARLAGVVGRGWWGWAAQLLVCGLLVRGAWIADPHLRDSETERKRGDWSASTWADDAAMVRRTVPESDLYLDCSGHAVNTALLPAHLYSRRPILNPAADFCRQWVTDVRLSGDRPRWLSVSTTTALKDPQTRERVRVDRLVAQQPGWSYVASNEDFQLWTYRRPE